MEVFKGEKWAIEWNATLNRNQCMGVTLSRFDRISTVRAQAF